MKAELFIDGGARPTNPGHGGIGCILILDTGEVLKFSRYLGKNKTNNQAEWTALIVGTKIAVGKEVSYLEIFTDCKMIANCFNGKNWIVKSDLLKPLVRESEKILFGNFGQHGENWLVKWIARDKNFEADALCTAAIQYGRNKNIFIPASIKEKRGEAIQYDWFS